MNEMSILLIIGRKMFTNIFISRITTPDIVFMGDWNASFIYNINNVVVYNFSLWLCTEDQITQQAEPPYGGWWLLAKSLPFA